VGLSVMTNFAAGMVPGGIGHGQTISVAKQASGDVRRLLRTFLEGYA
jgi:purine nucleoside phosphorylase